MKIDWQDLKFFFLLSVDGNVYLNIILDWMKPDLTIFFSLSSYLKSSRLNEIVTFQINYVLIYFSSYKLKIALILNYQEGMRN